jgi:hypothetical protein
MLTRTLSGAKEHPRSHDHPLRALWDVRSHRGYARLAAR